MKITVYSTPTCSYCHQLKQYLKQNTVSFEDIDVSRDAAQAAEMVRLTGQRGVPVTVAGDQVIVGFDRPRIDQLIKLAKRPRLGASVADAAEMAAKGRTVVDRGVYVGRVRPDGLAARAGLRQGDVLVSFGNQPLDSSYHLERLLAGVQPHTKVPFSFVRDGETRHVVLGF